MSALPKVLVVDDEPIVLRVCQTVLERNDFQAVTAVNGVEALARYKECPDDFVLVLSDISMPCMDGIDMAREMFAIKPHTNIILMTGFRADSLVPEDLARLCSTINKPFTPAQMLASVRKCLKYEEDRKAG